MHTCESSVLRGREHDHLLIQSGTPRRLCSGGEGVGGLTVRLSLGILAGCVCLSLGALPPVPVPPENPMTESKRVLGKMLFWEEQLSTASVVSCGTCHMPNRAGTDPRLARAAGDDGVLNTPDDVFGSPGVVRSDANDDYEPDPVFALRPQITDRAANAAICSRESVIGCSNTSHSTFSVQGGVVSEPR